MLSSQSKRPAAPLPSASTRAEVCRAWLKMDTLVEKQLGKTFAGRPYWVALLELYLAEIEQRAMFSSCFLTGETPSNVHRRSVRLAKLGALTRQIAAEDHRRVDLRLTPATRQAIERVLDAAIALEREGGLPFARQGVLSDISPSPPVRMASILAEGRDYGDRDGVILPACKEKITSNGQVSVPHHMRRSLDLNIGDTVLVELEAHAIRIRPASAVLHEIRQRLGRFAQPAVRASDHLIRQRRAQALRSTRGACGKTSG